MYVGLFLVKQFLATFGIDKTETPGNIFSDEDNEFYPSGHVVKKRNRRNIYVFRRCIS